MRRVWQQYASMLERHPLATKASTAALLMSVADAGSQIVEMNHRFDVSTAWCQQISQQSRFPASHHDASNDGNRHPPVVTDGSAATSLPPPSSSSSSLSSTTNWTATSSSSSPMQILQRYDASRTMHVAITGFTFSGPISHAWYNFLERVQRVIQQHHHHQQQRRPHSKGAAPLWIPRSGGLLRLPAAVLTIQLALDAILFSPFAVGGYLIWRSVLEDGALDTLSSLWSKKKLESKWISAIHASWSFWPVANIINFTIVPVPYRVLYNNSLSIFWNAYLSNLSSSGGGGDDGRGATTTNISNLRKDAK